MSDLPAPIDAYTRALADRDVDRAVTLYGPEATVVQYEGVARGPDEIRAFLVGLFAAYDHFDLISVDQVQRADDMVIWDSTNETGGGVLRTTNIVQLDDAGLISRHIPLVGGYWGRT